MEPTTQSQTPHQRVDLSVLAQQINLLTQQRDNESQFSCTELPTANKDFISELNALIAS